MAMSELAVRRLGRVGYTTTLESMRSWTRARGPHAMDEIWLLEHPPVYTRGVSCTSLPRAGVDSIPVVDSDRGGQMTYHGPGQLIVYLLLDLRRLGLGIRQLVNLIEQVLVDYLAEQGLVAGTRSGAPGVYIGEAKIAALGLRVCSGCTYHGLSFNVGVDLAPFSRIDPCGYHGLAVTSLCELGLEPDMGAVADRLQALIAKALGMGTRPCGRRQCA